MNVTNLSRDYYYLFGSFRISGKGNGSAKEDFICGPTHIKRDTATKRWKRIIKDGLGIQVNMYSNKHTIYLLSEPVFISFSNISRKCY